MEYIQVVIWDEFIRFCLAIKLAGNPASGFVSYNAFRVAYVLFIGVVELR